MTRKIFITYISSLCTYLHVYCSECINLYEHKFIYLYILRRLTVWIHLTVSDCIIIVIDIILDEWAKIDEQNEQRTHWNTFNKSWWSVDWWTCYYFWTLSFNTAAKKWMKKKIHFMIIIMITVIIIASHRIASYIVQAKYTCEQSEMI